MTLATRHHDSNVAWYVVYSKPQREAWAELHLRRKGIEAFHPQLELPHYAGGRRRCVPLFPNYVFVQIDLLARFYDVVWSPGVKSFVGAGGAPASLDETVVAFLKRNATPEGRIVASSDLKAGQEVEIVDGPFAGLVAIIQEPPDAKGRIRVLMRLLNQRPVSVQVPVRFVRSGWVA
jgi:transcriptional antiterminator RfaH